MTESSNRPVKGALDGFRVIDLSRVLAGPFCTQILGDHGADILKVESLAGDETRNWGPPFIGDTAAYFHGVNRNKRSIALDLSYADQRGALLDIIAHADVVIENFKAGTMARWGMDYAALTERFPSLVYCKITGFGDDGPLGGMPGYDAAVQAMSGLMSVNGEGDGPPLRMGVPIVDLVTGLNSAIGILLALIERSRSGRGQLVDMTLYDCALSLLHPHSANYLASEIEPLRSGNAHPNITPYDCFATATEPVFLAIGTDGQFAKFCEIVGRAELSADPDYHTNENRNAHRDQLRKEIEGVLATCAGKELAQRLMKAGVPCAPVLTVSQALAHEHSAHRRMIVDDGPYRGIASPIKLSATPASFNCRPPDRPHCDPEAINGLRNMGP